MGTDVVTVLRDHGIQPSAQRVAVARYILYTEEHPSADQVFSRVSRSCPMLSRATVYNTLNLFVSKGLLRSLVLAEGKVVFDPKTIPHHHFIDEKTGKIHDLAWDAFRVTGLEGLLGFEVKEYQVVLRGRRTPARRAAPRTKKRPTTRRRASSPSLPRRP